MRTLSPWADPRLLLITMTMVAIVSTLAGCAPAEAAGPRDQCGLTEPTTDEMKKVLAFGGDAFASDEWVRSYTVEPYKMILFRRNTNARAIAHTEYLIYTCGYGQTELDAYFSDEGFQIAFEDYESYSLSAFCEQGSLALYSFDLVDQGTAYTSHYWVEQTDDTHVTAVMLIFPSTSTTQLDEYSRKLFPDLASCK